MGTCFVLIFYSTFCQQKRAILSVLLMNIQGVMGYSYNSGSANIIKMALVSKPIQVENILHYDSIDAFTQFLDLNLK
jgi:hypothetical protein